MTQEEEIAQLKKELSQVLEQVSELMEQLSKAEERESEYQKQLSAMQAEKQALNEQLVTANMRIAELEQLKTPPPAFAKANQKKPPEEQKKARKKRDAKHNRGRPRSRPTQIVNMPIRLGPRYPAAFPETISVGAVDSKGVATTYSDFPAMYPQHNGIATLGGDLPTPIPPLPDPDVVTTAKVNDPVCGLYSADTFPALSAEDIELDRPQPPVANTNGWAYWSGTSFAIPIISAVAARVLESIKASGEKVASSQLSARVQWAITSPDGQQEMLTGSAALPTNSAFGANVGVLKAEQVCVPVVPEVPGAGPEPVAVP